MNLREVLKNTADQFSSANIDDPMLESEVLLRHVLGIDRTFLFSNYDTGMEPDAFDRFQTLTARRIEGEPLAYIIGVREFYGLTFAVNPSVLIPRPETELLVETAIRSVQENGYTRIVDVGTGSGCIAISLAVHLPEVRINAIDISREALETARGNARRHGVEDRISFIRGNLLESRDARYDLIVANLPYVDEAGMAAVNTLGFEPDSALYGGKNGLDLVRKLAEQAKDRLTEKGTMLLEIGIGQSEAVTRYLTGLYSGARIDVLKDLAGIDRVVRAVVSSGERVIS